ncbi:MAG: hypothetical protein AABZ74_01170 [Cyanobacteriota bacterium]
MKKNLLILAVLPIIISCGASGGTSPSPFSFLPLPSATPEVKVSSPNLTNNLDPVKKFDQPITKEEFPDPRVQVASYQKILKAIDLGDFEYVFKEYDAGGLKNSAIRAETEFNDYPMNYTISSIAQNIGQVGINKTNLYDITVADKKLIIKNALRNLLLQSVRAQSRRLVENNTNSLTDDNRYGEDVAKNAEIFFYGSDNATLAEGSVANFSKLVDKNNKISTYDNIIENLNKLKSDSKNGNKNNLIFARDKIETNLIKLLYISTLEKVATTVSKKDNNLLTEGEFFYLSMKNFIRSSNNENTFKVEKVFYGKNYLDIKYLDFEKGLASGIIEKGIESMNKALEKIESNNQDSINMANLGKMYLDIINSSYDNPRFTKTADAQISLVSDEFINAIKAKNKQKSTDAIQKMSKLLFK